MNDDALRDDIAQLEERIEALGAEITRCRKISFAAKVLIGAGSLWFALATVAAVDFAPGPFVAALAALLGGVVLLGSNATSWEQTEAALRVAEVARAGLIERIGLRMVGEELPTIH